MKARVIKQNDNFMYEIDGKVFLPAAFRSFRPTPANVSLFYRNGVRLFQMQCTGIYNTLGLPYSYYGGVWVGDHTYDFSAFDRQMKMFQKFAPEGYFMVMLPLDMPDWWIASHNCQYDSFYHLTEAFFEKAWIRDASDYLQAFIRYAEENYGDRIFAYSISAGSATEWFDSDFVTGERKAAAFRETVGDPDMPVPTLAEINDTSLPTLYGNDSHVYQYMKYCSGLTPQLIRYFAAKAQEVVQHQKVLGMFFGYTDTPIYYQNRKATNGYEPVWADPNIDIFFSPASYGNSRLMDGVSSYQCTVDSLSLHNKMYLHEIDHRTHLSDYPMENFLFLGNAYDTEKETITVIRRELCATAAKGGCLWWFDFMGGYYASPGMEAEIRHELQVLNRLYQQPHSSVAEIAVFVDPMSFLHMKDCTNITVDCVRHNRDTLHECGAPYDYYNLKDITALNPNRYKLFVFLNALDMTEEVKEFITTRLQNKTKAWVYAPNLFSGGPEEVAGISLREIHAPTTKVLYNGERFGFTDPTGPMFVPEAPDAEVLASYEDGQAACVRRGKQVYLSTGNVPASLWREIAREAGVHIYTQSPGALYTDSRMIARQSMYETDIELRLPFECTLEELFDGGIYRTKNGVLRYNAPNHETKLFLIREKTELQ